MINTKDPKVKEIMDGMHEAMLRKIKRGSQVKEEIVRENRIFSLICEDFDVDPTGIAVRMNHRYGYDMTGNEVIQILRGRRMANPRERKELFCGQTASLHFLREPCREKQSSIRSLKKHAENRL